MVFKVQDLTDILYVARKLNKYFYMITMYLGTGRYLGCRKNCVIGYFLLVSWAIFRSLSLWKLISGLILAMLIEKHYQRLSGCAYLNLETRYSFLTFVF